VKSCMRLVGCGTIDRNEDPGEEENKSGRTIA
jgi:hypothetical protein